MKAYYNDIDKFCCKVLRHQIALGNLPPGDVDERDIRDVKATDLEGYGHIHLFAGIGGFPLGFMRAGVPDDWRIITGGFPCQDISWANPNGLGITGARSGLWFDYARIIRGLRPDIAVVENSPALLQRGIDVVLRDLAACGMDAEWDVLPAAAFGAPSLRERLIIVAYSERRRLEGRVFGCGESPAIQLAANRRTSLGTQFGATWGDEPQVAMLDDGLSGELAEFSSRATGNAICPQVAEYIGRRIIAAIGK